MPQKFATQRQIVWFTKFHITEICEIQPEVITFMTNELHQITTNKKRKIFKIAVINMATAEVYNFT